MQLSGRSSHVMNYLQTNTIKSKIA